MGKVTDEVRAYAGRIDAKTTELGQTLKDLTDKLVDASTPEEVRAILEPVTSALEALGKNPATE